MNGQIFAPGNICTSTVHGGRISQGAREGGAVMSTWMAKVVPDNLFAFPPSMAVIGNTYRKYVSRAMQEQLPRGKSIREGRP